MKDSMGCSTVVESSFFQWKLICSKAFNETALSRLLGSKHIMSWLSRRLKQLDTFMQQSHLSKWTVIGILIGIVAGLGATGFYLGIEIVTQFMLGGITGFYLPNPVGESQLPPTVNPDFLLIPLVTIVGGLIAGIIIYSLAPEAEGHGTDEAIAAFHVKEGKIRRRIPLIKAVASIFTLGSGGSGGREGPSAQIGAGFGSIVSDFFRLSVKDRRLAVAAGIGAGIGTIFKSPFGGAILSAEILYSGGEFEPGALLPAFIAAPTGYLIFASITGFTPIFGNSISYEFNNILTLPIYASLGLACGLIGKLYSATFYWVKGTFQSLALPRHFRPMLGAIVTGVIGIFFPQVLGLGYGFLQFLIDNNFSAIVPNYVTLPIIATFVIIVFLKIIATSFSVASGGSAGVFGPSLVIGGFLGAALWIVLNQTLPGFIPVPAPMVIVGMMALFGGVGRVPIAVILMVGEMTGSFSLLMPAVVAVVCAYFVVSPNRTIYKSQVVRRSQSPAYIGEYGAPLLTKIPAQDAMSQDYLALTSTETSDKAYEAILNKKLSSIPVIDSSHRLAGIVTITDLLRISREKRSTTKVEEIMTKKVVVTSQNENLLDVMNKLVTNDIGQLPVVDRTTWKLIGTIDLKDVIRTYDKVVEWSKSMNGTSGRSGQQTK